MFPTSASMLGGAYSPLSVQWGKQVYFLLGLICVMESLEESIRRSLSLTRFCFLLLQLQAAWTGDCPADGRTWVPYKDRCYHFVHGEEDKLKVYNFENAKSLCPNSELLSIQSAEENDFVVKYSPEVWKGEVNVWLGMYYDTNSEGMMWLDEKPVKFTNWEPGSSPLDFVPMETCVAVHSDTGKWERVSCVDDLENGVVCETAQKPEEGKKKPSVLLSVLVILSVIAIMAVSGVIWFLHQKQHSGSSVVTAFEYHPPFRAPDGDHSLLVEAEELDSDA